VLDIKSGQSSLIYEDSTYSEPTWVGATEIILLKSLERGCTSLVLGDVSKPDSRFVTSAEEDS
jgi:hypothetical protein